MKRARNKWAIFISGRGSNLAAAIDEVGEDIKLVVVSSPKASGLLRAKRAGVSILQLPRPINWPQLTRELKERQINKIFLLGFMKIVPLEFIQSFSDSIFNLHPSLLPLYPGLDSIKRAYEDGANIGISVHRVIPEVDAGEILLQKTSFDRSRDEKLSLEVTELKVHQDEQLLVRKAIGGY